MPEIETPVSMGSANPNPPADPTNTTLRTDTGNTTQSGVGSASRQGGSSTLTTSNKNSPDPEILIRSFLHALENRDLEMASSYIGPGFVMQFPGADPMHSFETLVTWASSRYRFVRKSFGGFDVSTHGTSFVVYVRGTLSGEWLDGADFEGIRFIDRFEIRDGKIVRQDVWNDIATVRPDL